MTMLLFFELSPLLNVLTDLSNCGLSSLARHVSRPLSGTSSVPERVGTTACYDVRQFARALGKATFAESQFAEL